MKHSMLDGRNIHTSWLQKIPFLSRKHKMAGILRPWAFRSFDLSSYDLIICSSSAESKQVSIGSWRKQSAAPVTVYCHTPIRYYWSHFEEYKNMMEFGWLNPIAKFTLNIFIGWLRKLDLEAAKATDYFIANSQNTAQRIKKYYDVESTVIYPGVNTQVNTSNEKAQDSDYYISIGRCIPYKKFDLLVDAFNENGKNLILVTNTNNALYKSLKEKSTPNITWKINI